jgi:hypothetical protein
VRPAAKATGEAHNIHFRVIEISSWQPTARSCAVCTTPSKRIDLSGGSAGEMSRGSTVNGRGHGREPREEVRLATDFNEDRVEEDEVRLRRSSSRGGCGRPDLNEDRAEDDEVEPDSRGDRNEETGLGCGPPLRRKDDGSRRSVL